jgi:serine/threonine protein kinase
MFKCPQDACDLDLAFLGSGIIDGKYLLKKRLGQGGMGSVYEALHIGLERRFAVKLLNFSQRQNKAWLVRFEREAKALGRLRHPNIVDVTDYGIDPRGFPYLVTELLDGRTLDQSLRIDREWRTPDVSEVLRLLDPIASAIDFVHSRGTLHGDIKPSNIFLSDVPKLMDFGLAALTEAEGGGLPAGTPHYMAPELTATGRSSVSSDIYAFGVLCYQVFTGNLPFTGTLDEVFEGHSSRPPTDPSTLQEAIPFELDGPLLAMLAKDPATRPASAKTAMSDVQRGWLKSRRRLWRHLEIPRRVGFAFIAAMTSAVLTPLLFRIPVIRRLELRTVDARFEAAPRLTPDPRMLLVVVDEPSLEQNQTPLSDRADEFGASLEKIIDAGAASVAVDFLLPQTWSRSAAFSQLILRHADRLTFALYSGPDGKTIGTECMAGLTAAALAPRLFDSLFAFANIEEDANSRAYYGRISYLDRSGNRRMTWAAAAVSRLAVLPPFETFWLDYRIDPDRFERLSWKDVPAHLEHNPNLFHCRFVLVGGNYLGSGDDSHRSPFGAISGIALQALIANTLLEHISGRAMPVRNVPLSIWLSLSALLTGAATGTCLVIQRWTVAAGCILILLVSLLASSWLLFRFAGWLIPIVPLTAALLVAVITASLLRRSLPSYPAY